MLLQKQGFATKENYQDIENISRAHYKNEEVLQLNELNLNILQRNLPKGSHRKYKILMKLQIKRWS